jgi:hypothetical protein
MALVTCHECKAEISSEAATCPKCGATPRNKRMMLNLVGGLVLAGMFGWFLFGGGLDQQAAKEMAKVEQQVAADSVAQYEISKRNGNLIETCVHAGMVAAAYLQAKDEANHKRWLATQSEDCKKAGMPL